MMANLFYLEVSWLKIALRDLLIPFRFLKAFPILKKEKLINRADCFEKYRKEDVVFKQGDIGDTLFLVLQGKDCLVQVGYY